MSGMRRWMRLVEEVYHGTPHAFTNLSTDKIGSGEGAQAYGWGLYFAGNKDVAEWYRRVLTARHAMEIVQHRLITDLPSRLEREVMKGVDGLWRRSLRDKGLQGPWLRNFYDFYNLPNQFVGEADRKYYEENKAEIEAKITEYEHRYRDDPDFRARFHELLGASAKPDWSHLRHPFATAYRAATDQMERELKARGHAGNLLTVEIPEDDEFLMWDKPLSEQPEQVKSRLHRIGTFHQSQTGRDIYHAIAREEGSPQGASVLLASQGIPGIRYLDGSSRARGDGNYNYVVFDDKKAKVTPTPSDGT